MKIGVSASKISFTSIIPPLQKRRLKETNLNSRQSYLDCVPNFSAWECFERDFFLKNDRPTTASVASAIILKFCEKLENERLGVLYVEFE